MYLHHERLNQLVTSLIQSISAPCGISYTNHDHMISSENQMANFYMKYNTGVKWLSEFENLLSTGIINVFLIWLQNLILVEKTKYNLSLSIWYIRYCFESSVV